MCEGMEVREQLCGIDSLCSPLFGLWGPNTGHQDHVVVWHSVSVNAAILGE